MSKVNCTECGTDNESNSKYCQNCGGKLKSNRKTNVINKNPKTGLTGWWSKRSRNNRILTGIGGCCVGIILFCIINGYIISCN